MNPYKYTPTGEDPKPFDLGDSWLMIPYVLGCIIVFWIGLPVFLIWFQFDGDEDQRINRRNYKTLVSMLVMWFAGAGFICWVAFTAATGAHDAAHPRSRYRPNIFPHRKAVDEAPSHRARS